MPTNAENDFKGLCNIHNCFDIIKVLKNLKHIEFGTSLKQVGH